MIIWLRSVTSGDAPWLLGSSLLRYLAQFSILLALTWQYGAEGSGVFVLSVAICGPVFVVLGLGLRNIYLTTGRGFSRGSFRRARVLASTAGVAISAILAVTIPRVSIFAIMVVAASKWLDGVVDLESAIMQRGGRTRASVTPYLAQLVLAILGLALARTLSVSLESAIAMASLPSGALAAALARASNRTPSPAEALKAPSELARIFRWGIPLGLSFGVLGLVTAVPQYVMHGSGYTAFISPFATMLYISTAMELLLNALMQSSLLEFSRDPDSVDFSRRGTLALGLRWARLTVPLGLVCCLCYEAAAPTILGPEFTLSFASSCWTLINCLALALAFSLSASLGVHALFKPQPIINAAALAAALTGSWLLIPLDPLSGALAAVAVAQLVRVAGGLVLLSPQRLQGKVQVP